jgi:hypothetical protein
LERELRIFNEAGHETGIHEEEKMVPTADPPEELTAEKWI